MKKLFLSSICIILLFSCASRPILSLNTKEGRKFIVENMDPEKDLKMRMKITTDSLPGIFTMLNHSDPLYRLAGLKIIEGENLDPFYPVIFRKINDTDKRVSLQAITILKRNRFKSSQIASEYLKGSDLSLINSSLSYITAVKEIRMLDEITSLFLQRNSYLNQKAARAISTLTDWDSSFMQKNLDSDKLIAAGIILALSFYKNDDVLPLIILQLEKKDYVIQTAAQQALLTRSHIPWSYLEEMVLSSLNSKIFSALLIMEKSNRIEDYYLIFPLLKSSDSRIKGKARVILVTHSKEALPDIIDYLPLAEEDIQKELLLILSTLKEVDSIPTLLQMIKTSRSDVVKEVENTIIKKGNGAIPILRKALLEESSIVRTFALNQLLKYKDPGILLEENTRILKEESALQLLYQTTDKQLKDYLFSLSIGKSLINDILKLKEMLTLIKEISILSKSNNRYFSEYLKWESTLVKAKLLKEESIENKHEYFQTKDKDYLLKSKENRSKSLQVEMQSKDIIVKGRSLPPNEILNGKKIIKTYNLKRSRLIEESMTFSSTVRPLAETIYKEEGLELSEITREYQIYRRENPFLAD